MEKNFDGWNDKKKDLERTQGPVFYHAREVWWCSLGINIGFEQDGTGENFDRPVVILKGFNSNVFFGVALTGKHKSGKYYFPLGKIGDRNASAVLSQVRLIDTKRLVRKIETLDEQRFNLLTYAIKKALFE